MITRINRSKPYDTDLGSIIEADQIRDARLPDPTSLRPSEDGMRVRADEVLAVATLADVLEAFVEPEIADPALIMPLHFRETRRQIHQLFQIADLNDAVAILADQAAADDLFFAQSRAFIAA